MRLSVIQMNPGADTRANMAQAEALIAACVRADHPTFVALPEMWSCLGGDRAAKRAAAERLPAQGSDQAGGPLYEFLRTTARTHHITLHGGSIGEHADFRAGDSASIYNTTVVFDPRGAELARYRKIHLFDFTTPNGQGFCESATYGSGKDIVSCTVDGITVGLAICYDVRFAELFAALRCAGAELIVLPAAFTAQTGPDHWEPLLRARAIETQCWIAAPATTGRHTDIGAAGSTERATHGHSMICDPWGHVVAHASSGLGWASARLDPDLTQRVRRDMPVQEHRRVHRLLMP